MWLWEHHTVLWVCSSTASWNECGGCVYMFHCVPERILGRGAEWKMSRTARQPASSHPSASRFCSQTEQMKVRLTPGPGWAACLALAGSTGTGAGCWWGRRSARPSVRPASSRCRWSPPARPPRAPARSRPDPSPTPRLGPTKTRRRRRSWRRSCHPRPGASRARQGRDPPLQSSPPAGDISPLSCRLSALHCRGRERVWVIIWRSHVGEFMIVDYKKQTGLRWLSC